MDEATERYLMRLTIAWLLEAVEQHRDDIENSDLSMLSDDLAAAVVISPGGSVPEHCAGALQDYSDRAGLGYTEHLAAVLGAARYAVTALAENRLDPVGDVLRRALLDLASNNPEA